MSSRRTTVLSFSTPVHAKNPIGKPIRETDPLGRTTVYEYADNNIDLLSVKRVNGQDLDLIETRTYNSQHQPLTVTDARGATTTYTYNAAGQVLTVTTPPAEGHSQGPTTAFTYDGNGYLIQISGPVVGATTTVTYDGYGRRRTVTDPAGFTQIFDYDALNRMTKVTYPDGTYEETVYNRLDAEKHRDRRGHWTEAFHDALRRVVATRDAAGGTTQYQYGGAGCAFCGAAGDQLTALIDANGNKATWDYDLQGRMTQETRADASSETYVYETTTSRLKQKTDRKGVTTSFEYFLDGRLKRKSYSDSTPAVSYTYDPVTGQMLTAANGTDTLSWTYDSMDRVATETSAKNASTVGYDYDGAGNRTAVTLNGASYVSHGYDQYSRLTSIARGSSTFSFGYDTASRRASMTYPNGVVTSYTHDAESRLVSLGASLGGAPITGFSYAYDEAGNRTQRTSLDVVESYGYDSLNRLVSADRSASNPSRWRFAYDPVGNRTAAQTDDAVLGAAFNNVNELLSTQAGGALEVRGATSEPANVTVAGKPAQTRADNSFAGTVPIGSGTNSVVVSATDASGNTRTNTYQVNTSGIGAAYTYDGNGNLATRMEGTDAWAYTWNALNQLTKVEKNGSEIARFAYDPEGRRVEKVATGITTTYMYDRLAVLRESRGAAAFTYVHGTGLDEPLARTDGSGLTSYFHADGLGSVAALTTQAGAVAQQYRYDVWGNIEVGVDQPGYAFTGREWDPEIGLYYYRARYYDPRSGRFLSEDLGDDALIYAYVTDNPTTFVDALGMAGACFDITVTSAASCKADVQDAKGAGKDVGAKGCPLGITTRWGGEGICDSLLKKIKKEPLHFAQGCGSGCCKNKRELKGSSTQEETFEFYIFKDKNSDDWQSTQDALPKNIKQACKLKVKIKLQGVFEGWSGTCE